MAEMRTALGVPISHVETKPKRNAFLQWFFEVWEGFTTTLIGMGVTGRHFFRKPVTIQYPHENLDIPAVSRQRVHVDIDLCGGCLQCDKICPPGIITIVTARPTAGEDLGVRPNGKKRPLHLAEFTIDHSKCLYCGLCTTVCNDDAIYMIPDFHFTTNDRSTLFTNYSKYTSVERDQLVAAAAAEKAAKAAAPKPPPPPPAPKPAVAADATPVADAKVEAKPEEPFSDKCPGPDGGQA
ncbi:MAG: 4Fe-4S dicluster domain-containing protein [bacterium]|nr:4Fe-4S dicluster domain-containing protein [bacterium]